MRQQATHPKPPQRAASARASLVLVLLACLLPLLGAAPASAATITDRPFLFSFNGADTTAGAFVKPNRIAVDNSTGDVYVADEPESHFEYEAISKFNAEGVATNFSATGASSIFGPPGESFGEHAVGYDEVRLAVDNSGGPSQGRIYALERRVGRLSAFAPSGAFLWEIPNAASLPEDVAVDGAGHIWVLQSNAVEEFASSGSPPAQIGSCSVSGNPISLDAAPNGDLYLAGFGGLDKYVGCAFASKLDSTPTSDVYVDQSSPTGHVFASRYVEGAAGFKEFNANGTLLAAFDPGDAVAAPRGIAYNPTLDRVYVANKGLETVEAFGPAQTGTVPDPTIEAPVASGPGTATFHGTVNPQGVANKYYFEWAGGVEHEPFNNEHAHVFHSPEQSLPEDSVPHPVEYKARSLQGNQPWSVRLVTVNASSGLRTVSGIEEVKPPKAAAAPTVAINQPTAIGIHSVQVNGSVNPKEDSVTLMIEIAKGTSCAAGPFESKFSYIEGGEVSSSIPVSATLEKLNAATHYCVRMTGRNSFGQGASSAVEEFDTLPEPPSEVATAFAGPRTDTGARLNGRVNPNGDVTLKYRFDWSADGSTWNELPLVEENVNAHEPIVVSEEVEGLSPNTEYLYKLGFVEVVGAPGPPAAGEVKSFRTRTSAEASPPASCPNEDVRVAQKTTYLPDCRGIELVNSPDKGDQNVYLGNVSETGQAYHMPLLSPDGSRAHWSVSAGAPGGPSGVGSQFLALRTGAEGPSPTGWTSRSLAPPAAEQFGGGSLVYNLAAATPGHSRFVADLRNTGLILNPEATLVRLDDEGHEELLHTFLWNHGEEGLGGIDMSDDAAHVLTVSPESHQLVDVGSGSPEIVSVMPGKPAGTGSECGLVSNSTGGVANSFLGSPQWRYGYHMMASTDANLVYFSAKPDGECGKPWSLYVRDRAAEETTLIDPGLPGHRVEFVRASPDGRYGYFLTASQLDPADGNSTADLYRWNEDTKESTCLTCVVASADITPVGEGTAPVLVSDDLSHAYFVSHNRLVPGEGIRGGENIYALSGGQIRFVATPTQASGGALQGETATLSADGNVLFFRSAVSAARRLTTDPVECSSSGCVELYRYDERDGSIECVSCDPSGPTTLPLGANGGVGTSGFAAMSADGSTVAFLTEEALLPADLNHAADVYEWRGGVRHLLTDGLAESQGGMARAGVWGVDANGSNVLFSAARPGLTGFEQDGLANLYDARIDGGFLPPAPEPPCEGESCQGPLQAPPGSAQPSSAAFQGRGNVSEGPGACRRGKVRRHGRCVSRRPHKHKHGRHKHRRAGAKLGRSK